MERTPWRSDGAALASGTALWIGAPARSCGHRLIEGPCQPRHRHARRSQIRRPTSSISTTSIPTRPRAARRRSARRGTFDSFNPFILKGDAGGRHRGALRHAAGRRADEPFSEYGLLAETIEMPGRPLLGHLHAAPEARCHDGKPITADDVIWTFDIAQGQGPAVLRLYYARRRQGVEKVGERTVKFTFKPRRQPRAAADHRPAAGAAEALLGDARLRPDDARAAARQRPVQGRRASSRAARSPIGACPTTGARTCR